MTITEALQNKDEVIAVMGESRSHVYVDHAYRFRRERFPNGMAKTMPPFARGVPVVWIDDKWVLTQLEKVIHVPWTRQITVI